MKAKFPISAIRFLLVVLPIFFLCCINAKKVEGMQKDEIRYQEKHRPQLHFSPISGWMNDPNGMFYYAGKYHLFYQYYPDSTVWGPMHWGHAASSDLVHWRELPIALYPDSLGYIFSGGAVVDGNNTSQLGTQEHPPIVASFTHHDILGEKAGAKDFQKQSLAYSQDAGVSWQMFDGNPVIPNTQKIKDFRDPKVVWHPETQKWILALAAYDKVMFYASPNLKDWKHLSDFGIAGDERLWECPDLFPIKVEGSDEVKWVLLVSIQKNAPNGGTATSYFVGDFNGTTFVANTSSQKWLDWGTDNYAFVTWNNVPEKDGRVLGIGWMSNWQYAQNVPTEKWRSAMTLPRELSLMRNGKDYILNSLPVRELEKQRTEKTKLAPMRIKNKWQLKGDFSALQCEILLQVNLSETTSKQFGIQLGNELGEYVSIAFDREKSTLFVDRTNSRKDKFIPEFFQNKHSAPLDLTKDSLQLRLIIDASSLEIFIDDGALSFTSLFFPTQDFDQLHLFAKEGSWEISEATVYALNSIWVVN